MGTFSWSNAFGWINDGPPHEVQRGCADETDKLCVMLAGGFIKKIKLMDMF